MTTQIATIKDGKITLPTKLRKPWKKAKVFITGEKDTILIKRLVAPSLSEMVSEFREIGKNISKKDVGEAIKWARRKGKEKSVIYENCS